MSKSINPATQLYSQLPVTGVANAFSDYYPVPVSLGATGNQYSDYYWMCIDAMLQDEEITADLELRHSTSFMTPFRVEGSSTDLAFANSILEQLDLDNLIERCLYHADYGFNPVELDWAQDGGRVVPTASERRHPRSFRWGKDGGLLYSSTGGNGFDFQSVPVGKILPVVRNGSREKPYGESVLESAWAIWQSKWSHVEQLERLSTKYSVPTSIALTDSATNADLDIVAANMAALDAGGSVALSGVKEIVQLTASGKASELMGVIKDYDNKLAKLITGQTLMNGTQKYGSRALGEIQERAVLRIMTNDARTVYDVLNRTLLRWIFEFNNHPGKIRLVFDKKAFNQQTVALQGNGGNTITLSDKGNIALQRAKGLCL